MTDGDPRFTYGAQCTWFGPIGQVGTRGSMRLPCCPICGGMLFEFRSRAEWDAAVEKRDREFPGYKDMMTWAEGRHFRTFEELQAAYEHRV